MALLARGRQVVMVDVGERLEAERESLRAQLASKEPDQWSAAELSDYKSPQLAGGADDILRYGSNFVFRDREGAAAPLVGSTLRPSFALGGLSNAWGAAVLPYRASDLSDWPIGLDDLAPHYREVAAFMPIAGRKDDLQALFPVPDMSRSRSLQLSTQAEALLDRAAQKRAALARMGVTIGAARQAAAADCRRCGLCLHGCPYEYIFKASQVVAEMLGRPGFAYRPGLKAVALQENGSGVRLTCRREDGSVEEMAGERLFVAAGVLPTAGLVLPAVGRAGDEVDLLDSQHLFLPLLHAWRAGKGDPALEARHTLTQAFVELADPAISPWSLHAQVYTYNEFYAPDMRSRYPKLPFADRLFEALSRRLLVAQTFLHSAHSARIRLAYDGAALQARVVDNPETGAVAARAVRRLAAAARLLGCLALTPATRLGAAGSSFHVGGSFPMSRSPSRLQTDLLGRPLGMHRVYLVDASVLPTIPATTITYSVMANAHRIGSLAP